VILEIDPASPVPIYLQLIEQVRRMIAIGALRPGDQLPTVRELAVQCRVNRNTVARVFQELEREGFVRTKVGQGTFVSDEAPGLEPGEQDAILDGQIDRLLVESRSLGVPLEQIPSRLWRRIEQFRKETEAEGGTCSGGQARAVRERPGPREGDGT
jgi:GntR family transcriptional regulator